MNIGYASLHLSFVCPPLFLTICNYRCKPCVTFMFATLLSLSHLTLFIYTIIGLCLCYTNDFPDEAGGLVLCVQICIAIRTMIYAAGIFLVIAHYMKCILTLEEEEEINLQ